MCRIISRISGVKCKERLSDAKFICVKTMGGSSDCSLPFDISTKGGLGGRGRGGRQHSLARTHEELRSLLGEHTAMCTTLAVNCSLPRDCFHF